MIRFLEKIENKILIFAFTKLENNINIGKGTSVRKGFYLRTAGSGYIEIGEGCFFNRFFSGQCFEYIKIGQNCIFGENVKIYDHNHEFRYLNVAIKDQGFNIKGVSIGDNVWVGSNVVILKGVHIGNNSVIAAGSIVKSDVPENSILRSTGIEPIRYIKDKRIPGRGDF